MHVRMYMQYVSSYLFYNLCVCLCFSVLGEYFSHLFSHLLTERLPRMVPTKCRLNLDAAKKCSLFRVHVVAFEAHLTPCSFMVAVHLQLLPF